MLKKDPLEFFKSSFSKDFVTSMPSKRNFNNVFRKKSIALLHTLLYIIVSLVW